MTDREMCRFGQVLRPWLTAALLAAVVPCVLLAIWNLAPGARPYLTRGEDEMYFPLIGLAEPLRGTSWTFAWATAVIYLAFGLVTCGGTACPPCSRRAIIGRCLLSASACTLCLVLPMMAAMWALAVKDGLVPPGSWGEWPSSHGPWRYRYNLRGLLNFTLQLPLVAGGLATASGPFLCSWKCAWMLAGSLAVFIGLMGSHYWLID